MLGGIFDPIHVGHLTIAEQVRDELGLERVLFVPAGRPVHKGPPTAEATARMRMIEMAIADNPAFDANPIELHADRPSYTAQTLATLVTDNPGVELVLIVSSETASYLPTWYQPEVVLDLATIAIVSRLGFADISREWIEHHFPGREDRFVFPHTSRLGHSSTEIRERVRNGQSIRYLVPAAVEAYIGDNDLYDRPTA